MNLEPLINKTVPLRFAGADIKISLSHALFSSYDIDSGTRLLLKALATQAKLEEAKSLCDIGCGTGVIGIAAAKAFPALKVLSRDRDALALAFTRMNAAANDLGRLECSAGLLLDEGMPSDQDRIASNLPAKAGREALEDFFQRAPAYLSPNGSVWVVIVNSLAPLAETAIRQAGHEILFKEASKEHSVFGFCAGAGVGRVADAVAVAGANAAIAAELRAEKSSAFPPIGASLAPYIRGSFHFSWDLASYDLESARDIPDFDSPGFGLSLCVKFLESRFCLDLAVNTPRGICVWAPGQGHIPLYCASAWGERRFLLAGRDFLELSLTARNLKRAFPETCLTIGHGPDPGAFEDEAELGLAVTGGYGTIIAFPELVPGYPWQEGLFSMARQVLPEGGSLIIQSSSAALSCLDKKKPQGFSPAGEKREKACRVVRFKKR